MKFFFTSVFSLFSLFSISQVVFPFEDYNYYFKSFENENFRQLEFQRIKEYKYGDEFVAYIDTRGNLRVYDGKERQDISNLNVSYKISDHLMGYGFGPTLNMWEKGKLQTLTYFAQNYEVRDSLIVFEDTRFNTINVYWNNKIREVFRMTGDLEMPTVIGDNIFVYKDNGNNYKIYYQGASTEIGVWNGTIDFQVGCDIICFNDPTTRTFAAFDHGQLVDVENFYMNKYRAGRGFIVYEDLNNNLILYKKGEKTNLSNFGASQWEVKDDMIYWVENNLAYVYQNNEKILLANYIPKDYQIKNNTIAFRNIMGGVSTLNDGKVVELTNQQTSVYEINGNSVLINLFNRSYLLYSKGNKYEF
ncbi:MAG: hypothetical protein V4638_04340 [Bacteroidota bacterium]